MSKRTPDGLMGERIRALRESRGYSLEVFARLLGVTKSAVSQWELGNVRNIRPENLLEAARILLTTPDYLLYGPRRPVVTLTPASYSEQPDKRRAPK